MKPEPLDQMALYSSHFAKAPSSAVTPHPASVLSGMSQQAHAEAVSATSSMLTGLPHLTPAPFNTHSMHQGFPSLDDMKYHNTHQIHPAHAHAHAHQHHPDYSSFAASAAANQLTSGHLGSFSSYPGLGAASEHSNHHHHHAKLNLQTT